MVEDAPEFRRIVVESLSTEGFEVRTADDGEKGLAAAREFRPDVIVLDVGLPLMDGVEVCRRVRTFSDAYIVMLTSHDEEIDKLIGLSVGADDYMTKPFSPRELVARIRAMLRRPRTPMAEGVRRIGDLAIDTKTREVSVGGEVVELTKIEFDLLDVLSADPGVVFSRSRLLDRVWGPGWRGEHHVVDVHIANLRRKLGERGGAGHIRTVRGVGFRMEKPG